MCVSVWPKRSAFVSVSCDASAKVWDIRAREKCVGNFTGHKSDINCVSWFADGFAFGTGSDDASTKLFDVRAYRQVKSYAHPQILSGVTSLKFSASGKYLFTGYDDPPFMISWSTLSGHPTQNTCSTEYRAWI